MIGPFRPGEQERPKFAQLHIHNNEHEIDNRMTVMKDLDRDTLEQLKTMLHEHTPLCNTSRQLQTSTPQKCN